MERDFTYIDDAVSATIKAIHKIPQKKDQVVPYKILNIGGGKKIDLIKFIKIIEKSLKIKAKKNYKKIQIGDVKSTLSDIKEMKTYLNFQTKVSIKVGIQKFIKWYKNFLKLNKTKICVIGLGYVGLPLSVELSKKFSVVGYDKNQFRVQELLKFNDNTNEIKKNLKKSKILFSGSPKILKEANFFIITVPTPVNSKNLPDLTSLITASKLVAKKSKKKRYSCIRVNSLSWMYRRSFNTYFRKKFRNEIK